MKAVQGKITRHTYTTQVKRYPWRPSEKIESPFASAIKRSSFLRYKQRPSGKTRWLYPPVSNEALSLLPFPEECQKKPPEREIQL